MPRWPQTSACTWTEVVILSLSQPQAVESGYHPNPYHNKTHAADVVQVTHYIIHGDHGNLKGVINMNENDQFACILAACMHDFDHPVCTSGE